MEDRRQSVLMHCGLEHTLQTLGYSALNPHSCRSRPRQASYWRTVVSHHCTIHVKSPTLTIVLYWQNFTSSARTANACCGRLISRRLNIHSTQLQEKVEVPGSYIKTANWHPCFFSLVECTIIFTVLAVPGVSTDLCQNLD